MIITRSELKPTDKTVIYLSSSQGNAFFLIGMAKQYSKDKNLDYEKVHEELTQSDYEHLLQVFDNYFGDIVTMVR